MLTALDFGSHAQCPPLLVRPPGLPEEEIEGKHSPRATYRIQLTPEFGFAALQAALPYLQFLGISDLYLSPVFRTRPGSRHGYDVTDHSQLNPELGTVGEFRALSAACRVHGMGIVLDIVPNHMAVMTGDNRWWLDVLENGPASKFARCFDIDWTPTRASMRNRLLVPILGGPLGDAIDQGEISFHFDAQQGSFFACYADFRFPLDPRAYSRLFRDSAGSIAAGLPSDEVTRQDFLSLLDAFDALPAARPAAPATLELRDRDKEVNKRRLARLCERDPAMREYIDARLAGINGARDEKGAQAIADLLDAQPYRLAFWRVSGEEINYRRFFDVNELAALRMEDQQVFDASHVLVRDLWRSGDIRGVRIDHADGLHDPAQYLDRLRDTLAPAADQPAPLIVVEKILEPGEKLPGNWAVDGTTGYEFGALVTGWLMQPDGAASLEKSYRRFIGSAPDYGEIVYMAKKQVMRTVLAAELSMLAARLDRIAQLHRNTSDFTLFDLREALVEVIACFPVYRTYISQWPVGPGDVQHLKRALGSALNRKQGSRRALEFLGNVLLGETRENPARVAAALEFTLKFQQVTGPVMAKGVEDTSFYRYPCLLAMNEVGSDPQSHGTSMDEFHRDNEARARDWPRTLLSTSTHDSKRGEDARYRLCVLSEIPGLWQQCVGRWRRLKRRGSAGSSITPHQEYLLLQSLLAIWPAPGQPLDETAARELRQRMEDYALKAAREAKDATSWLDPDPDYEAALRSFVGMLLPDSGAPGFLRYFQAVLGHMAYFGLLNALSATVIKFTAPGIPDLYQGNELPQLVLVDPDNRSQVDLGELLGALQDIARDVEASSLDTVAAACLAHWHTGSIKLFVSWRLMALRKAVPQVFASGAYLALQVIGERANHLGAYARTHDARTVLVLASRWTASLCGGRTEWPVQDVWVDTQVELPPGIPGGSYFDLFTGRAIVIDADTGLPRQLDAQYLLDALPVCVLVSGEPVP